VEDGFGLFFVLHQTEKNYIVSWTVLLLHYFTLLP